MAATLFVPQDIAHWVTARPWLHVRPSNRARLEVGDVTVPIEVRRLPLTDELTKPTRRSRSTLLVIAGSNLPRRLTDDLEAADLGYVDSSGRLHLPWARGLIHVELGRKGRPVSTATQRTLGVHGVRAVQAILEAPTDIKVSDLATQSVLSASHVHTVLKILEEEGLLRTRGRGPATTRDVVDRGRLLDWLAAQPAARRRESAVEGSLYARTPIEGLRKISGTLEASGIPHALTGSAAAMVLGAGPTNLLMTTVRVTRNLITLEDAMSLIGAEPTDRGANLRLVHDVGNIGSPATRRDRVLLAPLPRIYLDLLAERRGEDLAKHFRETILGY